MGDKVLKAAAGGDKFREALAAKELGQATGGPLGMSAKGGSLGGS